MIPKIIHYCWLSGDEFPVDIKRNLQSWKKLLPEYEFILWDTNKINLSQNKFAEQAFEKKKYAFAADYVRMFALQQYGGIYMDLDVEVLKNFNNLLHLPYFIGEEYSKTGVIIEAAIIGAEKNAEWVTHCVNYYSDKSFVLPDGSYDLTVLPAVIKKSVQKSRDVKVMDDNELNNLSSVLSDSSCLYLFPYDYFSPKDFRDGKFYISKNTYTVHHFNSSWLPKFSRIRRKIKNILGVKFTNRLVKNPLLNKMLQFFKKIEAKSNTK
ncbi:hypothetical protein BFP77_04655 [Maribacter sp. 4U21]|uniref:glycosyltransferase family 32 protein n=1 Tax=Maribacter sp. 4U21 TaxID=1889779 RepID=UPI000C147E08|nr:glycosyltransferase [Maribacter sp. 4U21]PIB29919.1 hypothetical protein BFP77_04655 [Maribacter sp. 4U21]